MSKKQNLQILVNRLSTDEKIEFGAALVESGLSKEFTKQDYSRYYKRLKNQSKGTLKTIYAILQKSPEESLERGLQVYLKSMNPVDTSSWYERRN